MQEKKQNYIDSAVKTINSGIEGLRSIIEDSLITYLSTHNIEAESFKDRVGIWVIKSVILRC